MTPARSLSTSQMPSVPFSLNVFLSGEVRGCWRANQTAVVPKHTWGNRKQTISLNWHFLPWAPVHETKSEGKINEISPLVTLNPTNPWWLGYSQSNFMDGSRFLYILKTILDHPSHFDTKGILVLFTSKLCIDMPKHCFLPTIICSVFQDSFILVI